MGNGPAHISGWTYVFATIAATGPVMGFGKTFFFALLEGEIPLRVFSNHLAMGLEATEVGLIVQRSLLFFWTLSPIRPHNFLFGFIKSLATSSATEPSAHTERCCSQATKDDLDQGGVG